jgi:hypothetical protein
LRVEAYTRLGVSKIQASRSTPWIECSSSAPPPAFSRRDLLEPGDQRMEAAVEPDLRGDARGRDEPTQLDDVVEARRERLLAEERLAGVDGGADELAVRVRGGADDHRVDLGVGDHREGIGREATELADAAHLPEHLGGGVRRRDGPDADLALPLELGDPEGVDLPDDAASDQSQPRRHGPLRVSPVPAGRPRGAERRWGIRRGTRTGSSGTPYMPGASSPRE